MGTDRTPRVRRHPILSGRAGRRFSRDANDRMAALARKSPEIEARYADSSPASRAMKAMHASICDSSMNSSGLCA
jgi:hypothetical protein